MAFGSDLATKAYPACKHASLPAVGALSDPAFWRHQVSSHIQSQISEERRVSKTFKLSICRSILRHTYRTYGMSIEVGSFEGALLLEIH